MRPLRIFVTVCLLLNSYACTRTLTRSQEVDLREPIFEGKARSVTIRSGHTYELSPPNTFSFINDTLHFQLKKTGRLVSGSQEELIPLADIEEISVNNPTGTVFLLTGIGIGIFLIVFSTAFSDGKIGGHESW